MKKLLISTAVATLLMASTAVADTLVIAGASESGGYFARATNAAERLVQRGFDARAVTTNGSEEITLGICNGSFTAGYTQVDAMFARAKEGCNLFPAAVYGEEYALMLVPSNSDINELSDLDENHTVLINREGSGANLMWRTIVSIEQGEEGSNDDWSRAQVNNDPFEVAYPLAEAGLVDAVIVVATLDNPTLTNFANLGWETIEFWDKDINDQEFNGAPLYESEKIKGRIEGRRLNEWGYVVKSFGVITNETRRDSTLFPALVSALAN